MAETAVSLDVATRVALQKLADVSVPPPVSWIPQTWGWAVLTTGLLALIGWLAVRGLRRYRASRYRREGLGGLARIEARLADGSQRDEALAAIPELLKRVALAAWPRTEVASLSGEPWIAFLRAHGGARGFSAAAARLLDDLEYRSRGPTMSADEASVVTKAVRNWIEDHVVSA
jgi:hypothetical protein